MSVEIDLYRTDDYVRAGRVMLLPLLTRVFEGVLGRSLTGSTFELVFLPIADDRRPAGQPSVVNLNARHGYIQVRILQNGHMLYQHPHAVREIIGRPLQLLLRRRVPTERHWGYGFRGPGLDKVTLVRPTPVVDGLIGATTGPRRARVFHLEEVKEPEPPTASLADLAADVDADADVSSGSPVRVVVRAPVAEVLTAATAFSTEVEEGGFLAGHVYCDADRPGGYLVEITEVIAAERTGASLLHFTFTGESFLRMNERLAVRGQNERLVGWYHTHLFPATSTVGLSSVDVELHTTTFMRPWQIAGLVNIDQGSRLLRFYHAEPAAGSPAASSPAAPRLDAASAAPVPAEPGESTSEDNPTDKTGADTAEPVATTPTATSADDSDAEDSDAGETAEAAGAGETAAASRDDDVGAAAMAGPGGERMVLTPYWVATR